MAKGDVGPMGAEGAAVEEDVGVVRAAGPQTLSTSLEGGWGGPSLAVCQPLESKVEHKGFGACLRCKRGKRRCVMSAEDGRCVR